MYREASNVFRLVGDVEGTITVTGNLGDISLIRGNLAGCGARFLDVIPGLQGDRRQGRCRANAR